MAFKKETKQDKALVIAITVILIFIGLIAMYPVVNTVAVSLSSGRMANRNLVEIIPKEFSLSAWEVVIHSKPLWKSLYNTVFVTFVGSILSLVFTAIMAYPLANKKFRFTKIVMLMIVITMVFRFPIIPYFLTVRSYGLINTLWVLIVTHLLIDYNLIIMRTFFLQLPAAMEESATIEGANHLQILFKIYVPLSKPVFATLFLFFAVTYWNLFMHPMFFIQDPDLATLQPKLLALLHTIDDINTRAAVITEYSPMTVKAATIMFATLPILVMYPFLQKYFVKGAMLGSVKG